jgi:hypothetical protein
MTFDEKRAVALKLLAGTGMWRSSYEPPLWRLLWRLGVEIPPPHFMGFWRYALFSGAYFAVGMALLAGVQIKLGNMRGDVTTLVIWLIARILYGLLMALITEYCRRKHHLPKWRDL